MAQPTVIRAAAIQLDARLADVEYNLSAAERLVDQATEQGATWIGLPSSRGSADETDSFARYITSRIAASSVACERGTPSVNSRRGESPL